MTETTNYNYLSSKIPNKARRSSSGGTSGTTGKNFLTDNTQQDGGYDLSKLSERGNYVLGLLETAEVNRLDSAFNVIDAQYHNGKISKSDVDIMKKYYKEYVEAK